MSVCLGATGATAGRINAAESVANARGMTIAILSPGYAGATRNATGANAAMTSAAVPAGNARAKTRSAMNTHASVCRTVPGVIAVMMAAAVLAANASPVMNALQISV